MHVLWNRRPCFARRSHGSRDDSHQASRPAALCHGERRSADAHERAGGEGQHLGNIYKARVANVEPSLDAAFLDLGNVYPLVSDLSLSDLRYSAGLGLRYRTALGPLRLDWGVKLNPRPNESGYRIHLTIGNAY